MKKLKFIKEYLTFNKSERRGIVILLALILALIVLNIILPELKQKQTFDFSPFEKDIKAFEQSRDSFAENKYTYQKNQSDFFNMNRIENNSQLNPFPFDPNKMNPSDWEQLGLKPSQIISIEKYKAKGGKFRKKEDFKRMYCISDQEYETLEAYIIIETINYKPDSTFKKSENITTTELNNASSEDLKKIKGIGDYFAGKIIEYRQKLGGYYKKEQLMEIKHMDTAKYHLIEPYIHVNERAVRRININKADFKTLSEHPYIGYNIAISLTNYRSKHGNYNKVEDIKKTALITNANYDKISIYLKTD